MKATDVRYDPAGGPVVIRVRRANGTRGRFRLSIEEDFVWTPVGQGDLSDAVPDVIVVPVSGARLNDRYVLLVGSYSPGGPHDDEEIHVTYEVTQENRVIHSIPIREQREGGLSAYHLLRFVRS